MGKINQGILGGFNGTTGSVVGSSWKGIAYMRGKAQSIKNPRTELQMENRGNFGFISDLMSKALAVVNDGFKAVSVKKSPFNTAVQVNMKSMIINGGEIVISEAKFSDGKLLAPQAGNFSQTEMTLTATVESLGETFEGSKVFLICVFTDSEKKPLMVIPKSAPVVPSESTINFQVAIPTNLAYEFVYAYAFSFDDATKEASPTTYVGELEA